MILHKLITFLLNAYWISNRKQENVIKRMPFPTAIKIIRDLGIYITKNC